VRLFDVLDADAFRRPLHDELRSWAEAHHAMIGLRRAYDNTASDVDTVNL
jgi:hypothetical protein